MADDLLIRLSDTIASRRGTDPAASYVARLMSIPELPARKLGEEAVETVIAALAGSDEELVAEAADLVFHLCVLLAARGLHVTDVLEELSRREGISGIAEKAARTPA
ncbi:phosphoribosyl-ATP diphosphatase [Croceicoccus sp. F390]|uniref:Phosphoribosyl-ATP pyrophosphatase n=1 Tax=Croceicoccus esteveae TaxID=3075597 RepID=A0ABU2ZEU9_9SPHN|nr:phosphoribosyl-ATP diphosphatase [Croceicoccus sp. F390]MDT0574920.1 phosphoribosyl-ATP diphosphatase [Croceicoccus sp. F390]